MVEGAITLSGIGIYDISSSELTASGSTLNIGSFSGGGIILVPFGNRQCKLFTWKVA